MMMVKQPFWNTLVPDRGGTSQRYEILQEIASGGMATVYLGCRRGPAGFERLVAIKRAAPYTYEQQDQLAHEAQLAARVHHPNVVSIIDVEVVDGKLLLVMDYVEGSSLAQLMSAGKIAPKIAARIMLDVCEGLEAIHTTCSDDGTPLGLVHRDISPQNILVGIDGVARIADFGIALGYKSARTTSHDSRRGKPGYMAPDYLKNGKASATDDVYSLAIVLWEVLSGRRLFGPASSLEEIRKNHQKQIPPPSQFVSDVSRTWDTLSLRALGRTSEPKFESARELGRALEEACDGAIASRQEVGKAVRRAAHESLWLRRAIVRERLRASQIDPMEVFGERDSLSRLPVSGVHEVPTRRDLMPESQPTHALHLSTPATVAKAPRPWRTALLVLVACLITAIVTALVMRGLADFKGVGLAHTLLP